MKQTSSRSLLATILILALAGCIASEGPASTLSASEGSGSFIIYMVLEQGQLVRSDAWWADDAPDLDLNLAPSPVIEAIILKNDVAVDRVPVLGNQERAFLLWNSANAGTTASAGDEFEVLILNGTTEAMMATFALSISP